ncbi:MAG: DUF6056 family protein [Kofleriaceae bacterium]
MKPNTARVLRALFYAYVAATVLHIAYVVHCEPFSFDAWNIAIDTHAEPPSIGKFFSFWHQQYTSSNPRIGQPLAYLAYKYAGVAEVGTPLAYLAIVVAAFTLGCARFPSRKNGRDLATLAVGIGFLWFAAPNLPSYMFCRAYATNYIWAIAFQLWFLVPLRLHAAGHRTAVSTPKLAAYAVLGIVAGMSNEHTGPTLLLFAVGYAIYTWRKRLDHRTLVWVGALAAFLGYALVFFAPGQSQRYQGLAERYSLVQQILVRGFSGNLDIFLDFLSAAAPLMLITFVAVAIGGREPQPDADQRVRQRSALGFVAFGLGAGILITVTVFASPKLGPRFNMHAMALLLGGTLGVINSYLHRTRSLAPFVVFAVIASVYAGARTIPLYTELHRMSDERLAGLAATPIGGVYTAEAWPMIPDNWWTLGDDVRDQKKQELVANYFGLHRVVFRGGEPWKVLGVSDAKTTYDYEFDQPIWLDKIEELDLQPFIGRDIRGIHHAFLDRITDIEIATKQVPRWIDLKVSLRGEHPPMPRHPLYLARWKAGVLEGYWAELGRVGRSKERRIVLSDKLTASPWEIFLVRVGDEPRRLGMSSEPAKLVYVPWRTGEYWTLACKPDHCFVVMAVSHMI